MRIFVILSRSVLNIIHFVSESMILYEFILQNCRQLKTIKTNINAVISLNKNSTVRHTYIPKYTMNILNVH